MTSGTFFQQRLLEACEQAGCVRDGRVNVYRLARLMNPENPPERLIRLWLTPHHPPRPSAASLDLLSRVLGVPPAFFVPEMSEFAVRMQRDGARIAKVLMRS